MDKLQHYDTTCSEIKRLVVIKIQNFILLAMVPWSFTQLPKFNLTRDYLEKRNEKATFDGLITEFAQSLLKTKATDLKTSKYKLTRPQKLL